MLPPTIKLALHDKISNDPMILPTHVCDILNLSVRTIDDNITSQFLDLFPGGLESLNSLDDSDIRLKFYQEGKCNPSYDIAAKSLGGTTLILSLIDPRRNLWIVNLGGKQAQRLST